MKDEDDLKISEDLTTNYILPSTMTLHGDDIHLFDTVAHLLLTVSLEELGLKMPSTSSYSPDETLHLRMELSEKLLELAIEECREPNDIDGIPDVNDMAPAQLVLHAAEVKKDKLLAAERRDLQICRLAEGGRRPREQVSLLHPIFDVFKL